MNQPVARSHLSRRKSEPLGERALFAAFASALALAPLWYGGFGAIASAAAVATLCLIVIVSLLILPRNENGFPVPLRVLAIPALCYGAVVLWTLAQALVPVPVPLAAPIWRLAAETLQIDLPGRISVAPFRTLLGSALLIGYALCFWIALQLGRNSRLALRGLEAIALACVIYALWALVDHFAGWNRVLFEPKDPYALEGLGGFVTGTFRNRDHFAAYCGLGFACILALTTKRLRDVYKLAGVDKIGPSDILVLGLHLAGLALLVGAIWHSRSRSIIALSLMAVLALACILALRSFARGGRAVPLTLFGATLIVVLAAVVWIIEVGASADRVLSLGKAFDDRLALYKLVANAIVDNPWTGVGHGAFIDAFPVYRTSEAGYGGAWNAAHNIYLESLFGLGLPAFAALALAIGWCVMRVFIGAVKRHENTTISLAAALGALLVLLHGIVDFSLQTPAVAFTFAAMLGFGCAQSWSREATRSWSNPDQR